MGPRFTVAIQPDDYGPDDASSPRWTQLLRDAGHDVRTVDVYAPDVLSQVRGCDGFMWRWGHLPSMKQVARRLLPVLERDLGMAVYPSQATSWHYDDKLAQQALFDAHGLPTPRTWVCFDRRNAEAFAASASLPLVVKLASGAGSTNVALVRTRAELDRLIARLFGSGVHRLVGDRVRAGVLAARLRDAVRFVATGDPPAAGVFWERHKDYLLAQEFLPGNDHDTRVTVIGDRAFGYRRMNRPDDFRASGSGRLDLDPAGIDPAFVRLAFTVADALGTQSCAIDGLWRDGEAVVNEISYTYVSSFVQRCPGHWDRSLQWHDGHLWPEEAQVADFLALLARRAAVA